MVQDGGCGSDRRWRPATPGLSITAAAFHGADESLLQPSNRLGIRLAPSRPETGLENLAAASSAIRDVGNSNGRSGLLSSGMFQQGKDGNASDPALFTFFHAVCCFPSDLLLPRTSRH